MTLSSVADTRSTGETLSARVAWLVRRHHRMAGWAALLQAAWVIASIMLAWILFDAWYPMPGTARLILAVAVLVTTVVRWRFVYRRPRRRHGHTERLTFAHRLEHRHGLGHNPLINALWLEPIARSATVSLDQSLATRRLNQSLEVFDAIDPTSMIDRRAVVRHGVVLATVLAAWMVVAVSEPWLVRDGLLRLVDPIPGYVSPRHAAIDVTHTPQPAQANPSLRTEHGPGRDTTRIAPEKPAGRVETTRLTLAAMRELADLARRLQAQATGLLAGQRDPGSQQAPHASQESTQLLTDRLRRFSSRVAALNQMLQQQADRGTRDGLRVDRDPFKQLLRNILAQLSRLRLSRVRVAPPGPDRDGTHGQTMRSYLHEVADASKHDLDHLRSQIGMLEQRLGARSGRLISAADAGQAGGDDVGRGVLRHGHREEEVLSGASPVELPEAWTQQVPGPYRHVVGLYFQRLAADDTIKPVPTPSAGSHSEEPAFQPRESP